MGTQYLNQSSELSEKAQALFKTKILQSKIIQKHLSRNVCQSRYTRVVANYYSLAASEDPGSGNSYDIPIFIILALSF
jgi:hypothetical protein